MSKKPAKPKIPKVIQKAQTKVAAGNDPLTGPEQLKAELSKNPAQVEQAKAFLRTPATPEQVAEREKPHVIIHGGNVTATKAARDLFTAIAKSHEVFYTKKGIVRLVREDQTLKIEPISSAAAVTMFENYVHFYRRKKEDGKYVEVNTTINETHAKIYINSEQCGKLLPNLEGIIHSPILILRDHKIHAHDSGYDKVSKLYVDNDQKMPEVPLADAVKTLKGVIEHYHFKTPADHSRALASLITPGLKMGGFITGHIPVEVAEADQSQSGKSYRQRLVAAVYHEQMNVVLKAAGGVGSLDESFQAALIAGSPFIQLDNVRGKIDSQVLEGALTTQGNIMARAAFKPSTSLNPAKHFIFISSNGFQSTTDLANRSSIIRIEKRQNFNYPPYGDLDQEAHIYQHYTEYLASVHAVIRHWYGQGKPRTRETRHDFKEWCQSCDWIVQNIFNEAPLMDGHEEAKARASNPHLSFFRELAVKVEAQGRLREALTATNLSDICEEADLPIPTLTAEKQQDIEQRRPQLGKIMKLILEGEQCRDFEGYRVVAGDRRENSAAGNAQTRHTYTITKLIDGREEVPFDEHSLEPDGD